LSFGIFFLKLGKIQTLSIQFFPVKIEVGQAGDSGYVYIALPILE
jgi:hypothetical protein